MEDWWRYRSIHNLFLIDYKGITFYLTHSNSSLMRDNSTHFARRWQFLLVWYCKNWIFDFLRFLVAHSQMHCWISMSIRTVEKKWNYIRMRIREILKYIEFLIALACLNIISSFYISYTGCLRITGTTLGHIFKIQDEFHTISLKEVRRIIFIFELKAQREWYFYFNLW